MPNDFPALVYGPGPASLFAAVSRCSGSAEPHPISGDSIPMHHLKISLNDIVRYNSAKDMAHLLFLAMDTNQLKLDDLENNLRLAEKKQWKTKAKILRIYIRRLKFRLALKAAEEARASRGGIAS